MQMDLTLPVNLDVTTRSTFFFFLTICPIIAINWGSKGEILRTRHTKIDQPLT